MVQSAAGQDTGAAIRIAVIKKAFDAYEEQGSAMVGLIKDAANVAKAPRGAVSAVAGPTESGANLSLLA